MHAFSMLDEAAAESGELLRYVSPLQRRRWERAAVTNGAAPSELRARARDSFGQYVALVAAMQRAKVPLLAGTDEGNPYCIAGFGLHDELRHLVAAGLAPLDALRSATQAPAQFFGRESDFGAIRAGSYADLVVVDADPLADITNTRKIFAVVSRGQMFDRSSLDRMLADVDAGYRGSPLLPASPVAP